MTWEQLHKLDGRIRERLATAALFNGDKKGCGEGVKKSTSNSTMRAYTDYLEELEHANDGVRDQIDDIPCRADDTPWVYFITPTCKFNHRSCVGQLFNLTSCSYKDRRVSQLVDMIRLSQTLMHDKRVYWVVIEDNDAPSRRIRGVLERSGLFYAHVAAKKRFIIV